MALNQKTSYSKNNSTAKNKFVLKHVIPSTSYFSFGFGRSSPRFLLPSGHPHGRSARSAKAGAAPGGRQGGRGGVPQRAARGGGLELRRGLEPGRTRGRVLASAWRGGELSAIPMFRGLPFFGFFFF